MKSSLVSDQWKSPTFPTRRRLGERQLVLAGAVTLGVLVACLAQPATAQTGSKASVTGPQSAAELGLQPSGLAQIQALMAEKAGRTPVQQKIASSLLYAAKLANGKPVAPGVSSFHARIADDISGRSNVKIVGTATPRLLQLISSLGGTVLSSFPQYHALYAMIDVRSLETVAALPEVLAIRRPSPHQARTGPTESEGDVTHLGPQARSTYSVYGAGIKVGVLSDSANAQGSLANSIATGEITAPVVDVADFAGGSDEGDAMMEIVADLAPNSPLYFATAYESEEAFAQNIINLQSVYGCRVIADDVGYFDEPVFQDGIIAQAVNTVAANGALYFSAAGNDGNVEAFSTPWLTFLGFSNFDSTWSGPFNPSGFTLSLGTKGSASTNITSAVHTFAPGFGTDGLFDNVLDSNYEFVGLEWSDPYNQPTDDYDIYMLDSHGANVIAASTDIQDGQPGEVADEILDSEDNSQSGQFDFTPGDRIYIVQYAYDNVSNHPQQLYLSAFGDGQHPLYFASDGSTFGHAAAPGAFGVAAAPADVNDAVNFFFDNLLEGPFPNPFTANSSFEAFSSAGPRIAYYDQNGNYLNANKSPVIRLKPDVTAADGVSTSVPGFAPFYGTSAATPHAAGIASLLLSQSPGLSTAEARTVLTSTALTSNPATVPVSDIQGSWNANMGYGIVMAKAALDFTGNNFISAIAVSNITASGATFSWTTTLPSSSSLDYGVGGPFTAVAATNGISGLTHTATLGGLKSNSTYLYHVQATTLTGSITRQTANAQFKTAAATTGAPVLTATAAAAVSVSKTLVSINVTLKNTGTGPATNTVVTAATLNGVATTTKPLPTIGSIAPGATASVTLTFAASAVKPDGTGRGQGNIVTVSTRTTGASTLGFTNPISVTGI